MSAGGKLPGGFGPPPDDSGPPPAAYGPPPGGYGPPPGGYGPPPGGYGAAGQARAPAAATRAVDAPPAPRLPVPIADRAAFQSQPLGQDGLSKKVGLPVLGLVVIGVRVLLAASRTSSPSHTPYAPVSPAWNFDKMNQPEGALTRPSATPAKTRLARATLAASKETGEVYWGSGSTIHHRTAAGTVEEFSTGANVAQLSAFGDTVCWVAEREHENQIVCATGNALASARVLHSSDATCTALTIDARNVYALQTLAADKQVVDAQLPNQVLELSLVGGVEHTVLRARIGAEFAFGGGFAYWADAEQPGADRLQLHRANLQSGGRGKAVQLASPPDLLVVDNQSILLSFPAADHGFGSIGSLPLAGGALTKLKIPSDVVATAMKTHDVLPDQLLPMRAGILARYGGELACLSRTGQALAPRKLPSGVTNVQLSKGGIVYTTAASSVPMFMALD